MKSALFTVTLAAAAAGAAAHNYNVSTIWTTEVVDVYTTFCPLATTIVHGNQTYTATDSHTLTITNCPCTVSKPVTLIASVECHSCLHPTAPNTLVPSPSKNATWSPSQPSSVPVPHSRILVPVPNVHTTSAQLPVGTTPSTLTPAQPTAGASRVFAVSGAALVGLAGLAAFAL